MNQSVKPNNGQKRHSDFIKNSASSHKGGNFMTTPLRGASLLLVMTLSVFAQAGDSISIEAGDGTFEFTGLLIKNSSFPYLRGEVTNKTNRDWLTVEFEIVAFDKSGRKLKNLSFVPPMLSFRDFKRGTTKPVGYGKDGAMIEAEGRAATVQLRLAGGTYDTKYTVAMMKPAASESLVFEDGSIRIEWVFDKHELSFKLQNKTDNPIKLDWNQVSYIDIAGSAQKVIHKGVRLITRNDPHVPSVVPPTAKLEDMVLPVSNIEYESVGSRGWRQRPMFPDGDAAKEYKGKSFSVFMPLEINGSTKNYTFTIQIVDVKY